MRPLPYYIKDVMINTWICFTSVYIGTYNIVLTYIFIVYKGFCFTQNSIEECTPREGGFAAVTWSKVKEAPTSHNPLGQEQEFGPQRIYTRIRVQGMNK